MTITSIVLLIIYARDFLWKIMMNAISITAIKCDGTAGATTAATVAEPVVAAVHVAKTKRN